MAPQHLLIEDVLPRVRTEYLEMPGLRLTAAQAQRLWGLDPTARDTVLTALDEAKCLRRLGDATFVQFEYR